MRCDETAIVQKMLGSDASEKASLPHDLEDHHPSSQARDHRGVYYAFLTLFKSRE